MKNERDRERSGAMLWLNDESQKCVSDEQSEMAVVLEVIKGRKWQNVCTLVCLWIAYLLSSAAYSIIGPFFPKVAESEGAGPIITGVIISSSPLSVVILSPILGYFLPQLGIRFMVFSGLLMLGGAFILLGFMPLMSSGWMFIMFCILLRMTEGIGSALFITATFALLPNLYPHSVGTLTGLFEMAGGFGFAVGPPLGGLLYQVGGFRLPFFSMGGVVLLIIIPCTLLVPGNVFNKKQIPEKSLMLKLFMNFPFMVLVSVNILSLTALSFFTPILQIFLCNEFSLTPLQVGLVFLSAPVVYMIFSFVVGPLSDKFGPRYFLIAGLVVNAFGFFFFGPPEFISSPKIWITCIAFSFIGLASAFTIIPVYPDMLDISKKIMGSEDNFVTMTALVSGIVTSTLSFGEFIGPLMGGALTEKFSLQMSSVFLGEVFMAEALLLLGVTVIDKCTGL